VPAPTTIVSATRRSARSTSVSAGLVSFVEWPSTMVPPSMLCTMQRPIHGRPDEWRQRGTP